MVCSGGRAVIQKWSVWLDIGGSAGISYYQEFPDLLYLLLSNPIERLFFTLGYLQMTLGLEIFYFTPKQQVFFIKLKLEHFTKLQNTENPMYSRAYFRSI